MARVLIAWELGGGHGHIRLIARVADALVTAGHRVFVASASLENAHALLGSTAVTLLQAPLSRRPEAPVGPILNFPAILSSCGFAEPPRLLARARAWHALLELAKPELVVSDYAPGVLIAAKALGVDTFSIGNGFTIPPAVRPSPVFFGQRQFPTEVLTQAEAPLMSSINAALAAFSKVTVNSVCDLYPTRDCALLTWPQLDHHVQRPSARYFAQEYVQVQSASPPWPASGNVKVFAYCHRHYRHLTHLMAGLKHSGASCIVVAPEIPEAIAAAFSGPTITVVSHLVNVQSMISTADIVVTNGHNTCAIALEQATPTIVLPMHTEQAIVGQRLASQNLGSVLAATPNQPLTSAAIATEIEKLLANDSIRQSINAASAHISVIKSGSDRTTVSDEILERLT